MKHPTELLSQYLLAELDDAKQKEVEKHLETCPECQQEFNKLSEGLVAMVDNLPEAELSSEAFERIKANISQDNIIKAPTGLINKRAAWQSWAIAASLLIGLSGVFMAFQERINLQQISYEQEQIKTWLADSSTKVTQIRHNNELVASILLHDDGKALFVINQDAPKDQTYQLWGHKDGKPSSLGLASSKVYEVDYTNYDAIGISLEPKGGSPQPTRALGKVPVS